MIAQSNGVVLSRKDEGLFVFLNVRFMIDERSKPIFLRKLSTVDFRLKRHAPMIPMDISAHEKLEKARFRSIIFSFGSL